MRRAPSARRRFTAAAWALAWTLGSGAALAGAGAPARDPGPPPIAQASVASAAPATACPASLAPPPADANALAATYDALALDGRLSLLLWLDVRPEDDVKPLAAWLRRHGAAGIVLPGRASAHPPWLAALRAARDAAATAAGAPLLAMGVRHGAARAPLGAPLLPSTWSLAAARSPALAYLAGRDVAAQWGPWGVDLVVGPSLTPEPLQRPASPRDWPFGNDAALVAQLGGWLAHGLHDGGLGYLVPALPLPAARDANRVTAGLVDASPADFAGVLLAPEAVRAGAMAWLRPRLAGDAPLLAVVSAHAGLPAAEMAVAALAEGADGVVVASGERDAVFRALRVAAEAGALPPARLAAAAGRTLALRLRHGARRAATARLGAPATARGAPAAPGAPTKDSGAPAAPADAGAWHGALLRRSAAAGVTLLRNRGAALPLAHADAGRLLVVAQAGPLAERLGARRATSLLDLPRVPSRAQRREVAEQVARLARGADAVVVAVHNAYHREIVARALTLGISAPVVVLALGPPGLLAGLPRAAALLCAYDGHEASQLASAAALLGEASATGTLPPGLWPEGMAAP